MLMPGHTLVGLKGSEMGLHWDAPLIHLENHTAMWIYMSCAMHSWAGNGSSVGTAARDNIEVPPPHAPLAEGHLHMTSPPFALLLPWKRRGGKTFG